MRPPTRSPRWHPSGPRSLRMFSLATSTNLPSTTRTTRGRTNPQASQVPTPKTPLLKSRRPWTSSQSHLHLTTRLTSATLCFNAWSTTLYPQTRLRQGAWLVVPRPLSSLMGRCISVAPRASLCVASHDGRESSSYRTYTQELVATMPHLGH